MFKSKTNQNKVPFEFDSFYRPILLLKKLLQSKVKELEGSAMVQGLVLLHFATFVMCHLQKQLGVSTTKCLIIRSLIEQIMQGDAFKLEQEHLAKLFHFIDGLAKELNTTYKPYIYIALYNAYLDAEIYRHFHPNLGIYDFAKFQYVQPETLARVKEYHDVSIDVLNKLNLSIKEQPLIDKTMKLQQRSVN